MCLIPAWFCVVNQLSIVKNWEALQVLHECALMTIDKWILVYDFMVVLGIILGHFYDEQEKLKWACHCQWFIFSLENFNGFKKYWAIYFYWYFPMSLSLL